MKINRWKISCCKVKQRDERLQNPPLTWLFLSECICKRFSFFLKEKEECWINAFFNYKITISTLSIDTEFFFKYRIKEYKSFRSLYMLCFIRVLLQTIIHSSRKCRSRTSSVYRYIILVNMVKVKLWVM